MGFIIKLKKRYVKLFARWLLYPLSLPIVIGRERGLVTAKGNGKGGM
jgi:hypothetical protein